MKNPPWSPLQKREFAQQEKIPLFEKEGLGGDFGQELNVSSFF
jgi:hypothetical protein